eukprot:Amastigsp_a511943_7.p2 type:complete len:167 gc:universal Amastigsp_a511943_7:363-863(+)
MRTRQSRRAGRGRTSGSACCPCTWTRRRASRRATQCRARGQRPRATASWAPSLWMQARGCPRSARSRRARRARAFSRASRGAALGVRWPRSTHSAAAATRQSSSRARRCRTRGAARRSRLSLWASTPCSPSGGTCAAPRPGCGQAARAASQRTTSRGTRPRTKTSR